MICGEAKLRPRKKVHSGAFERESPRLNRLSRCTRHRLGTTPVGVRKARCRSQFPHLQGNSDADRPGQDNRSMRIPPASMAFTLLLSFLVALPSFGIDMSLPALTDVGAALRVAPAQAGLIMSLFMFGFAVAPIFYGPASDRYGRKPVVVFACTLFIIAGIGSAFARSFPSLLAWRVV